MAVGSGLSAQLGIGAPETTVGTAVTPTRFYEFNSETLDLALTRVDGMGLHAGGLNKRATRSVQTTRTVSGGFAMNAPTRGLGLLLQQCLGSFGQTLATPTQIASSGAYKQVHQPGLTTGKTFTIQKGVPQLDGTVQPYTYPGCKIIEWTLACDVGAIATLSVVVDGMDELTLATTPASPALATASYTATAGEFNFQQGTVLSGGTASTTAGLVSVAGGTTLAKVKSFSVTMARPVYGEGFYFGNAGVKAEQIENDWQLVTGSMTIDFISRTAVYDLFRANTTTAVEMSFVGAAGSAGTGQANTLDIILPAVKLNGDTPKVGGPDIVSLTVPFEAYDDGTNATIQTTLISADTTL